MGKYHYIRRKVTWNGKRYEVRGKTEAEALEKLTALIEALKEGKRHLQTRLVSSQETCNNNGRVSQ